MFLHEDIDALDGLFDSVLGSFEVDDPELDVLSWPDIAGSALAVEDDELDLVLLGGFDEQLSGWFSNVAVDAQNSDRVHFG